MFAHAFASKPCSETTNMPYWGQWLLCCGWKDELNSNNIGDTSSTNHENIDRIENFKCVTWVNSDYNNIFGNQWCFVESKYIANGYAMQKLIAAQSKPVIAIRYCDSGKWGEWKCITAQ